MHYDYIFTAAVHLKKVQNIISHKNLSAPVAAFADNNEAVNDDAVYTVLLPASCLQVADLLNGHHEKDRFSRHNAESIDFIAPTAHILVVDDNAVNLQVARGLMESYQFEIDTASNGLEAIDMVLQTEYDLVFMDHMMPEMDGVDATVAIRKLEGEYFKRLPIIALTANALVGTREMFMREGMNDFLAKPIELHKLSHILIKWLPPDKVVKHPHLAAKKPMASVKKIANEVTVLNIVGVDTAQGILSVGGSKENYLRILSSYHADGVQKLTSLPRYISESKISEFKTEVHALKSTSATIGAQVVSAKAEALEAAAQDNDIAFIKGHIDVFLNDFHELLDSIRPNITDSITQTSKSDDKASGEIAFLKSTLVLLIEAIEFVNIGMIEESLYHLQEFAWEEEISKELVAMQKHLEVFDYDGLLECALRLKESL